MNFPLTQGSLNPSAVLFFQVVRGMEWVEQSLGYFSTKRSVRFKVAMEGLGVLIGIYLVIFCLMSLDRLPVYSKFKIHSGTHYVLT